MRLVEVLMSYQNPTPFVEWQKLIPVAQDLSSQYKGTSEAAPIVPRFSPGPFVASRLSTRDETHPDVPS